MSSEQVVSSKHSPRLIISQMPPRRAAPLAAAPKPKFKFVDGPEDIFNQEKLRTVLVEISECDAWTERRNPYAAEHENINYFELKSDKGKYDPYVKGMVRRLYELGIAPASQADSETCVVSVKPRQIRDFILEQNAELSEDLNKIIGYAEQADECAQCAYHTAENYSFVQSLQLSGDVCQKKKDLGHIDPRVKPSASCAFFRAKKPAENQR